MNYLKRGKLIVVFEIIFVVSLFASNQYYVSALNAYVAGDYKQALQWFEEAVQIDPSLESYDNLLKLRMGICAFAIGDLQRAKAYLEQYRKSNPIAEKILTLIDQGAQPTEEWMVWIRSKIPQITATSTPTQVLKAKGAPVILIIGVFVVSFSVTFLVLFLLKKRTKKAKPVEQKVDIETKVETSVSEVEKLVQQITGSKEIPVESDEKFKEIETQLDSIVQEILSKEKEKPKQETHLISQDDPFEILKKLEEKTTYDEEDAKLLSDLMNKIINTQEKSQDDSGQ